MALLPSIMFSFFSYGRVHKLALNLALRSSNASAWRKLRTAYGEDVNGRLDATDPTVSLNN
jgi:hypothetical protein